MKRTIKYIFGILTLISCENTQKSNTVTTPKINNTETSSKDTQQNSNLRVLTQEEKTYFDKYDILDADSIKIEGKIGVIDSKNKIEEAFGKPDNVEIVKEFCVSFFNNDDFTTYVYYGKKQSKEDFFGQLSFEMYKDTLAMMCINLRTTKKTLNCPNIILSKNTNLNDLKTIFPKSFASQYELNNNPKVKQIVVPFLTCKFCDDKFLLIFENDKLIGIEYHMDC